MKFGMPSIHENYVEFSNYVGSGTATFGVLTSGKHHLRFEYGDSVSFAHNDASIISMSIISNNDSLNVVSPGEVLEISVMLDEDITDRSLEITGASSKHIQPCGNSCFRANAYYTDLTFYEDPSNLALDGTYITFTITLTTESGTVVRLTESDFNIPPMLLSTLRKTIDSQISIAPAGSVSKNILGFTTGSETHGIEIITYNSLTYALTYGIDTTIPARIYKFVDISYIDDPILKHVHTAGESYAQTIPGITALNFSNEFPAFTNHTFLYVIRDLSIPCQRICLIISEPVVNPRIFLETEPAGAIEICESIVFLRVLNSIGGILKSDSVRRTTVPDSVVKVMVNVIYVPSSAKLLGSS